VKYPFHIVDVFSSTPFGGNQLAVLPDAAGISAEGMQKIARERRWHHGLYRKRRNRGAAVRAGFITLVSPGDLKS
jgi:trans-2,3-dihydro-3-hydroxyanthranilate isomerase